FVVNQSDCSQDIRSRFRVSGREAELWHADSGVIEPAGYEFADGRTIVPLHLEPRESTFVVFRKTTSLPTRSIPRPVNVTLAPLNGQWDVAFPLDLGAPPKIQMLKLAPWTDNANEGVK